MKIRSIAIALMLAGPVAWPARGQETFSIRPGELREKVVSLADPAETYALYLPTSYDHHHPVPVLLIFDPRSRGTLAAEIFKEGAEKYGWILISSNNTMSDGPPDPNVRAINALWPEMGRYAIDPKRIYAAGFSGGGILTLMVGIDSKALAGVIDVGGRLPEGLSLREANFAHYGASGIYDFNYLEMRGLDSTFEELGLPHRLDHLEGRHQWLTSSMATTAMGWLEVEAMKAGTEERDDELIRHLHDADLATGAEIESSGRMLDALRHYRMMIRTYDGLVPVKEAEARAATIETSPGIKALRKAESRGDDFEKTALRKMGRGLIELDAAAVALPRSRFRSAIGLDAVLRQSRREGYEGESARRVLESMYSQTSFYFQRDYFARGDMAKAARVLEIATEIHPELWPPHYNLACAYARLGSQTEALDELEKAAAAGLGRAEMVEKDQDLESVRSSPRFEKILATIRAND